jgi:hypothetical protein
VDALQVLAAQRADGAGHDGVDGVGRAVTRREDGAKYTAGAVAPSLRCLRCSTMKTGPSTLAGVGPGARTGAVERSRTSDLQKWLHLFEQLSPIYKWSPGGLRRVRRCPRRRASLANAKPEWAMRGAPRIACYAASAGDGSAARYFSVGVSRWRRE